MKDDIGINITLVLCNLSNQPFQNLISALKSVNRGQKKKKEEAERERGGGTERD